MKSKIFMVIFILFFSMPLTVLSQRRLLIIAPDEFMDELSPLERFKDCSLRPTTLLSLQYVYSNFAGADEPEKVKKCIAHYEKNNGIQLVLLVGDCDKFPVRYCKAINTEWGTKYYPADLYYADLYKSDGSFDNWDGGLSPYGGNGSYGEMDFNGFNEKNINKLNLDRINLHPDVAVARIPASTDTEVATFVNKIINYELKAPGNWFKNALWIVDGDWGDPSKKNRLDGYMTGFNIQKPYLDPQWGVHAPNHISRDERARRINNILNSGVGFANYFGHGFRFSWSWVYDQYDNYNDMGSLTNQDMLPITFAVSCYTGRFHFDACMDGYTDLYRDVNNNEWKNTTKVTTRPEPMAVQPSQYDKGCIAEEFLVMRSTGGIAYIGCTSGNEFGGEDLDKYFFEAYSVKSKPITLGDMWNYAQAQFINNVDLTSFFAYLHLYKVFIYGDPSLVVGGAFTKNLSGNVSNANGGPLKGYTRYRITGNVTVPLGQTLSADSSVSVLFQNGTKITAKDTNPNKGFIVKPGPYMSVCFLSIPPDPKSNYVVRGVKISGLFKMSQFKMRNGGEIKLH